MHPQWNLLGQVELGEDLATYLSYWLGKPPPVLYLLALKECTNNMTIYTKAHISFKRHELPTWSNLGICAAGTTQRVKLQRELLLKHLTRCDEHPAIL